MVWQGGLPVAGLRPIWLAVLALTLAPSGHAAAQQQPAVTAAASSSATAAAEPDGRVIRHSVVVPAPLAEVWQAWTTRDGVRSFFAPEAVIDARPGGAFQIQFDPLAEPGARGADEMRYMALQPMRMLSFDWNAPPHLPEARAQRTFVLLHFEPVDATHTRVRLLHSGWGEGGQWDQAHAYFSRAWGNVLANLVKRFEQGPIDWTAWMEGLRSYHAQQAAKAKAAAGAASGPR
ncbi:MAG: hypothetical protein RL722_2584 [Pseudomonadota bacterium]|jgi:uncharacterized protein YndB with AHSA1/START domain